MSHQQTVITNAGPLMALGKLNRLALLETLYSTVQMPTAVYTEVVEQGLARGEPDARVVRHFWHRLQWPIVPVSSTQIEALTLQAQLGRGERAVLALAQIQPRPLILMDDSAARSEARRLGISPFLKSVLTLLFAHVPPLLPPSGLGATSHTVFRFQLLFY